LSLTLSRRNFSERSVPTLPELSTASTVACGLGDPRSRQPLFTMAIGPGCVKTFRFLGCKGKCRIWLRKTRIPTGHPSTTRHQISRNRSLAPPILRIRRFHTAWANNGHSGCRSRVSARCWKRTSGLSGRKSDHDPNGQLASGWREPLCGEKPTIQPICRQRTVNDRLPDVPNSGWLGL
jgi:hypothetical protein